MSQSMSTNIFITGVANRFDISLLAQVHESTGGHDFYIAWPGEL